MSLKAEGLLKRLKDEAHDTERRGYFTQNRKPMTQENVAKLCGLDLGEFLATMTELVSVRLVTSASDGTIVVPEIVRQEMLRKSASLTGSKGGNPRLKKTLKGGLKGGLKPNESEHDHELVPESLKANELEIKEWLAYKRERGESYKPRGIGALWKRLESIPQDKRREAIEFSMASNYAGIFPSKGGQNGNAKGGATGTDGKYSKIGT